jgi:NAD(P)-dependent dehydrogenase (short-subunit alcohol dehydrogenase family)
MTDQEWDAIMAVHLKGSFACTKAAWPIFRKQQFGRVVNITSAAGLYGMALKFRTSQIPAHNMEQETLDRRITVPRRWV